ncbi:beta-lactamase class A [Salinimicrobium sediminis]|uniref:beta-lactamase n=1 Tax=Salinimicrobium sediminis TaxID=1343891 RepID=A0A285X1Y8_9FLAO|nr:serine hydrolase [Salinimicrobium sediminis]SOC79380.1 beta-lactamase class A [Salinimicrobium sediminis]
MKSIGYLFVIISLLYGNSLFAQKSNQEMLKQKTEQRLQEIFNTSPAITGLVAVDLTSGEKIGWNSEVQFPQASSIKIPVLMEVFKQAHEGKFSLSDPLPLTSENTVGGTGILKHLEDPAALSIKNLGILMIALSDNSATNALIDLVGMSEVNSTLKSLGMTNTLLQRKMMNSEASARGEENLATPADAAKILQLLYKGEFVSPEVSNEILDILKMTDREDSRLAAGIPENVPIAFKPGFISGVSTEWTIVLLEQRPYAVALMESNKLPGEAERVMEEVSEILFNYFWRIGSASEYGTYVDQ